MEKINNILSALLKLTIIVCVIVITIVCWINRDTGKYVMSDGGIVMNTRVGMPIDKSIEIGQ
jgi:hypothetical protein